MKLLTTNPNGNYECLGYGNKALKGLIDINPNN